MSTGFAVKGAPPPQRAQLGRKSGKFSRAFAPTVLRSGDELCWEQQTPTAPQPGTAQEVARSNSAAAILAKIDAVLLREFGGSANSSSLMPGFIFESLAARSDAASRSWVWARDVGKAMQLPDSTTAILTAATIDQATCNDKPYPITELALAVAEPIAQDVLLPCPELLPEDAHAPRALFTRMRTMLHDARRPSLTTPELIDAAAWELSAEVAAFAADECERLQQTIAKPTNDAPAMTVVVETAGQDVTLRCSGYSHTILRSHYEKLRTLFGAHAAFDDACFVMLQRYYALTGCTEPHREGGWHGALPLHALQAMQTHLGVSSECFASPLNATFASYFSAFPDVDGAFGSRGTFFDTLFVAGSYEANPPFDHAVVRRMATHMNAALKRSAQPLSFAVVMPYSDRGKVLASLRPVVDALAEGGFVTGEETVPAAECVYVDGHQQCSADTAFVARLDTRVFLLQNKAGAAKWPPQGLSAVIAAWRADEGAATGGAAKRQRED
jgi:hypothetical protein